MKVYKAINAVQADLCKEGITKDRKNQQQGYSFRGIDDVYNALSPLLAKHGLCILPRMLSRDLQERQTQKGGVLFYVTVEAEFDFVSSEDGSKHTVKTYGEAMDSGDKATNKAMSAAYKYAAFQTFAIPTEGDNDADAHTPHPLEASGPINPTTGAWERVSDDMQIYLKELAGEVKGFIEASNLQGAVETYVLAKLDADASVAFWTLFDSKERAAMKKEHERLKQLNSLVTK